MPTDATAGPGDEPLAGGDHGPASTPGEDAPDPWDAAEGDGGDLEPDGDAPLAAAGEEVGPRRRALGLLLAVVVTLAGSATWAIVTQRTGKRYALIAVAVGILVGVVVRRVAKISRFAGGLVAGGLALLSAALGQLAEGYLIAANDKQRLAVFPEWDLGDQWKLWGFSKGWETFTTNLTLSAWLTLGLSTVAAFIYAADSGTRKKRDADAETAAPATAAATDPTSDLYEPAAGDPGRPPATE